MNTTIDKKNFQKEISQKLLHILGITDTNKMFSLNELDNNLELQHRIFDFEHIIKHYFNYIDCTYDDKYIQVKRPYLLIIKNIFKETNIVMTPLVKINTLKNIEIFYVFH
jgi:hypothetical protein